MKYNIFNRDNLFKFRIGESSPKFLFGLTIFLILIIELLIMISFKYLEWNNYWVNTLFDSAILIIAITPFLYYFFYKPSLKYVRDFKRAEEALQDEHLLLRTVIDNIPDSIYCKDINGRKTLANLMELNHLGAKSEKEILGKTDFDIYPKEIAEAFFADDKIVMQTNKAVINREEYLIDEKGQKKWLLTSKVPLKDEQGNIKGLVGIGHDITKRKLAEESLHKFNLAIENSKEVIFMTDKEGIFTYVNPEFTKMYGFTAEEVVGKTTPRIFNSGIFKKEDFKTFWDTILSKQSIPKEEYFNKCKDGKLINIEGSADPVLNKNGDLIGFLGIHRDITERKQTEKEIREAYEKLSKINAEKDKFFSIIAHDLRSPFNSFLGLTEIMAEELPTLKPNELQKIAVSMRNSATNLYALLENLLQWARAEQGLIPFVPKKTELYSVVNESSTIMREAANNKGIEISFDIPKDMVVFADVNMIETVIRNLISNALKYTLKGGKISVSAKLISENSVEIFVQDSGIGMNKTLHDNLFRIDVQTNRKGTNDEPSSGLGLLLCKEFIEKNGGKIWVESEENKGSVFYFTLPQTEFKAG